MVKEIKNASSGKAKKATTTTTRLDLLNAIEQIVELSDGSNLSDDFFKKASKPIGYVCRRFEVTKVQAVLLSIMIDKCNDNNIELDDISSHLHCRNVRMIKHIEDLNELERRKLVRCSRRRDSVSYRVPMQVVEALKDNKAYTPPTLTGITDEELFIELDKLFTERRNDELTYNAMAEEIDLLLEGNKQNGFAKSFLTDKLIEANCSKNDKLLLLFLCHQLVNNDDEEIFAGQFEDLFIHKMVAKKIKNELSTGNNVLQRIGYIDFTNNEGMADRNSYCLTDKAKQALLSSMGITSRMASRTKELTLCSNIVPKRLFYNQREGRQIEQLASLLSAEKFCNVRRRLIEAGMRSGFACLFYGAPGTGKTETALQLARRTGRDIMQVDFSNIKSCWVGESEKNIKALFDRYRTLCADSETIPILLFNEADAIIGKRHEGAERAVDKMENTIQNIILQEMETLDGILIATTNLTQNMDKAFERRFLYKVEFTKPSLEAKCAIWQSMIPKMSDDDATELARRYDLSGGQIENIARKHTIENILDGSNETCFSRLTVLCDEELIARQGQRQKIGF